MYWISEVTCDWKCCPGRRSKSLKMRSNRNLLPKCGSDYTGTRNVQKSKCTEIEMYWNRNVLKPKCTETEMYWTEMYRKEDVTARWIRSMMTVKMQSKWRHTNADLLDDDYRKRNEMKAWQQCDFMGWWLSTKCDRNTDKIEHLNTSEDLREMMIIPGQQILQKRSKWAFFCPHFWKCRCSV